MYFDEKENELYRSAFPSLSETITAWPYRDGVSITRQRRRRAELPTKPSCGFYEYNA